MIIKRTNLNFLKHTTLCVAVISACSFSIAAPKPLSLETNIKSLMMFKDVRRLRNLGPGAYKKLLNMAFSPLQSMEDRWSSLLMLGELGGENSIPDIERAISHKTWFMRSAGLLALGKISRKKALPEAKRLLNSDKALLVRTTALQVLVTVSHDASVTIREELNNPINFKGQQSLPIRKALFKALLKEKNLTTEDIALYEEDTDAFIQKEVEKYKASL